ncbi:MAG: ABC transporter ATP-binding protein, partial [candidate division Zixibacteria bacterium]|nr:ABC transporter ATP-binding protein [candidate division Zixibacteria bacterium]
TINLAGLDIEMNFDKIKPLLGYMPQNFSLYPDLSVEENLHFYAGLFGLTKNEYEQKKTALYQFSGLGPFAKRRAGKLSGGMKQKLALSCNLIHDPKILILDEPTTGVDPVSRRQFWNILKKLKNDGATIIVSTPYMDEVALADRAVFMHNGQKLIEGKPDELLKHFKSNIYNIKAIPSSKLMAQLNQIDGITPRRFGSSIHLYSDPQLKMEKHYDRLATLGIKTNSISPIKPELEDLFIQLMEQSDV